MFCVHLMEPHYLPAVGVMGLAASSLSGKQCVCGVVTGGLISHPQGQDLISLRLLQPQNSLNYLSGSEGSSEPFNTAR